MDKSTPLALANGREGSRPLQEAMQGAVERQVAFNASAGTWHSDEQFRFSFGVQRHVRSPTTCGVAT